MYRTLLACAGALLASAPAIAADRIEAVAFPAGATTATLKGKVHGYDGVAYTLETREGQTLQLLFAPSNRFCFFNVFAPGDAQAVHMGAAGSNEFGRTIQAGGTYRAQAYLMRNAARRGDTCRYSLSVELSGAPGGASAGVSDAILTDTCTRQAAVMYGVAPARIAARPVVAAQGGFPIDGTADKGPEGIKKLRCLFRPDRTFDHIMAMTPDGE